MTIAPASAAVIFDGAPVAGGQGYGAWVNIAAGQNFVVKVDFANAVAINGFDIFISHYVSVAGNPVELKIFNQNPSLVSGLTPASYFSTLGNPQEFDFHATDIAHADFAPIGLAAGEYWIGLSSANTTDISWASYRRPDDTQERPLSDQLQLAGDNFVEKPGIHDLAFRIDGAFASAVPEPETWVLFILGFGFIGTVMRKAGPRPAFAFARATRRR